MSTVKPWARDKSNKKLWSVGIFSSIGHWQKIRLSMFDFEIFIFKFCSINWLSSSSVVVGEVTSLSHKVVDDSVEVRIFESESFGMKTKLSEVFSSFRDNIIKKLEDNFSSFISSEVKVEENFRFGHCKYLFFN